MTFEIDAEAAAHVSDLYRSTLGAPTIPASFTEPIRERFYAAQPGVFYTAESEMEASSFRAYVEAYMDLFRLLEEIRFELSLATLLLDDYDTKLARGEVPPQSESELPMPIPAESIALLLPYMREPPTPDWLFINPHSEFAGHRLLSKWFAGQLVDSVLVREVAACDRLATLLWTRAEVPIETTKAGRDRHPAFRATVLKELTPHYSAVNGWADLVSLTKHALFEFSKDLRDDFTHARRMQSELHGEQFTHFFDDQQVTEGLSADEHLALGVAFYNEVILPAIALTGELLASHTKPVPDGGEEKLAEARELFERSSGDPSA